jgi:transcriptional regulator with XRE-family HTH domain
MSVVTREQLFEAKQDAITKADILQEKIEAVESLLLGSDDQDPITLIGKLFTQALEKAEDPAVVVGSLLAGLMAKVDQEQLAQALLSGGEEGETSPLISKLLASAAFYQQFEAALLGGDEDEGESPFDRLFASPAVQTQIAQALGNEESSITVALAGALQTVDFNDTKGGSLVNVIAGRLKEVDLNVEGSPLAAALAGPLRGINFNAKDSPLVSALAGALWKIDFTKDGPLVQPFKVAIETLIEPLVTRAERAAAAAEAAAKRAEAAAEGSIRVGY